MQRILLIVAVVLPFFLFTSCNKENGNTGTLNLSITDAPIDTDGITGVFITITGIEYHTSQNNWQVFEDFEGPMTFNLLDLQRGVSELLGSFELEAGTYTQIRFMLDAPVFGVGQPVNSGSYLEFKNGSTKNLFVPSGHQTGYKAVGAFTVPVNGSVDVTADFDVRKSVVQSGLTGMYILKPTIRLVVDNQAGQIAGGISNIPDETGIVVYAYEAEKYIETEAAEPDEETTRFPNAVTSDMVDEKGAYHLAFLAPGIYDLVVVATSGGDFEEVVDVIRGIVVESKKTTNLPIDISELQ